MESWKKIWLSCKQAKQCGQRDPHRSNGCDLLRIIANKKCCGGLLVKTDGFAQVRRDHGKSLGVPCVLAKLYVCLIPMPDVYVLVAGQEYQYKGVGMKGGQ